MDSPRATCYSQQTVMLPAETTDVGKGPSSPFPGKDEIDGEAVLLTYGLFIYGDMHYITKSFSENVLKIAATYPDGESHFLKNVCLLL